MKNITHNILSNSLLIFLMTIILASCANNSYKEKVVQTKDMIMSSKIYEDKLIINQAQASVFEMVDYFSVNYPYSKSQIEKYFNTSFIAKSRESAWFDVVLLYPSDSDSINIAEMEVRSNELGKQLFIIQFKHSVCFSGNKFRDKMKYEDYELIARLGELSFDGVMDKGKNFGKMELFFDPIDPDNEEICIKALTFSTFKTLDRSKNG